MDSASKHAIAQAEVRHRQAINIVQAIRKGKVSKYNQKKLRDAYGALGKIVRTINP